MGPADFEVHVMRMWRCGIESFCTDTGSPPSLGPQSPGTLTMLSGAPLKLQNQPSECWSLSLVTRILRITMAPAGGRV